MLEVINEGSDCEVVGYLRDAARSVTGGNYTFAIDDIDVLRVLAQRAVDVGAAGNILHGSVLRKAQTLSLARAIPQAFGVAACSQQQGSPQEQGQQNEGAES